MTELIGFCRGDAAYLFADTAVTHPGQPRHSYSIFQEPHFQNGRTVEERLVKIWRLSDHAQIAVAGSLAKAMEVVDFLRTTWELRSPAKALESLMISYSPWASKEDVSLLIAYHDADGPHLVRWFSGEPTKLVRDQGLILGSLQGESYRSAMKSAQYVNRMPPEYPHDFAVATYCATMMWLSHHMNFIASGVGGAIIGGWIDDDGWHWQSDTTYILYRAQEIAATTRKRKRKGKTRRNMPDAPSLRAVTAAIRDDVLVLGSATPNQDIRVLPPALDFDIDSWAAGKGSELLEDILRINSKYYVFVARDYNKIVVCDSVSGRPNTENFAIEPGEKEARLRFRGDFAKELLTTKPPPGAGPGYEILALYDHDSPLRTSHEAAVARQGDVDITEARKRGELVVESVHMPGPKA